MDSDEPTRKIAIPRPRDQDVAHIVEEYVADAVVIAGPSSQIIFWNRAAEQMFGWKRDEMLGKNMHDFITPERHRERAKAGFAEFMLTGQGNFLGKVVRVTAVRKDGVELPVELALSPIAVEGQNCAVAVVRDVTRRAQLEEELHRLATTDSLTGLYNRREFFDRGNQEIMRSWRSNTETTVFVMDLDDFRGLNDRHGHETGDAALKAFTMSLRKQLRTTDVIGRVGGEEFAAVLPEAPLQPAGEVADRLRRRVADLGGLGDSGHVSLTVSIGVAQHRRGQESLDDTMKRADRALGKAKAAGGNRVWLETDEQPDDDT